MINSEWLINDGLTVDESDISNCYNNKQQEWTYNQGVILGALSKAYLVTNNETFVDVGWNIINGVMKYMTENSILHELESNEETDDSADHTQFKGVFMRYLLYFYKDLFLDSNYNNSTIKNGIENFAKIQVDAIKYYAENPKCVDQFGDVWDISFAENSQWQYGASAIAQAIAIDGFNWCWLIDV